MMKLIAVFPGQGSQHVGMAKQLFADFGVVRQTFEEASDAVRLNLKELCFDGPDSDLLLTENTQPCLLTASIAARYRASSSSGRPWTNSPASDPATGPGVSNRSGKTPTR